MSPENPSPSTSNGNGNNAAVKVKKEQRQARKYGFACASCRRRKARCDGNIPCDRCVANGESCYFNKLLPSVTYALTLQNRINACDSLLDRLRTADDAERLRLLEEHFSANKDGSAKRKRPSQVDDPQSQQSQQTGATGTGESPGSEASAEDELTELLHETSVDEDGRIVFYGSTSLFHLQPDEATLSRAQTSSAPSDTVLVLANDGASGEPNHHWRNSFSLNTPSPAVSAGAQTDIGSMFNTDITPELVNELLDTYWCFPHHLHLVLCRKIFMRDMASSGPYVTPFLLNAVLAQASRYSDRPEASKLSHYFAQRTLESLPSELEKGSSIPAIQGLLVFSARECASGRTSQGWLYSGMAFRMMRDMGIHIHPRKLSHLAGQFSPVELALRKQIYWSCYTWDKTMSLCLGRAPTIHDLMPLPATDEILDGEEAEEETWRPKFASTSALEVGVSQKAKTNTRFVAYCELCLIIDDVLATLYSKPHVAQQHLQGYLDRSIQKLEDWARALPPHLYVREDSRAVSCPPLHILLLNLLYHATIILLCRPYRSTQQRARKMATTAAEMIDRLFMLHVRRFGFRCITYLESYTMFVASTINILDLKEGVDVEGASARLALSLEVLRNATSTPSNARCVEIIEQLLRKDEKQKDGTPGPRRTHGLHQLAAAQQQQGQQGQQQQQQPPPYQYHPHASSSSSPPLGSTAPPFPLPQPILSPTSGNYAFPPLPTAFSPSVGTSTTPRGLDDFFPTPGAFDGRPPPMGPPPQPQPLMGIDTPLRWLPDNVEDDFGWMMMEMDFARDLENHMAASGSAAAEQQHQQQHGLPQHVNGGGDAGGGGVEELHAQHQQHQQQPHYERSSHPYAGGGETIALQMPQKIPVDSPGA